MNRLDMGRFEDATVAAVERFVSVEPGRVAHVAVRDGAGWGWSWRSGDDVAYPAASLTKVPLVAAALLAADAGTLDLEVRVSDDSFHDTVFPTVMRALSTSLTLRELAALSIVLSDNLAAQVLLDAVTDEQWTAGMATLGCGSVARPVGYRDEDFDAMVDEVTTVDDQVAILDAVDRLDVLAPLRAWMGASLRNTRISALIPPPARFHHKTGSLDGVHHDVGLLDAAGHTLLVVALTADQPDPLGTTSDMAELGVALLDAMGSLVR